MTAYDRSAPLDEDDKPDSGVALKGATPLSRLSRMFFRPCFVPSGFLLLVLLSCLFSFVSFGFAWSPPLISGSLTVFLILGTRFRLVLLPSLFFASRFSALSRYPSCLFSCLPYSFSSVLLFAVLSFLFPSLPALSDVFSDV